MRKLANSHPLLSSILSTTEEGKTSEKSGQEVATDGRPELDPIWIQSSHLQLATCDWSKMTFDPALGLKTVPPTPSAPIQNQFLLERSQKSSEAFQFQDRPLEDADMLVPLPESIISDVDPAELKTVTHEEGLDEFTPVPVTSTGPTGQLSTKHCPLTQQPLLAQPSNKDNARTHRPQFQTIQKLIEQKSVPSYLRPSILKKVEFNKNKVSKMSPRKAETPASKQVPPAKKGVKKPTNAAVKAIIKPGFNNQTLRKMNGLMKKLDNELPIMMIPIDEALIRAQQRQQWLQALNLLMANLNKKESGAIFALYHRYPFPRFLDPLNPVDEFRGHQG